MSFAESKDASISAYTQEYPDNKPVEVPPRPAWTGAEPRVSQRIGAYTHMNLTERPEKGH